MNTPIDCRHGSSRFRFGTFGRLGLVLALMAASVGSLAQTDGLPEDEATGILEEVRVVSSATRLTSGFDSPKPTTVIDKEAIDARGLSNLSDLINEVPALLGSTTRTTPENQGLGILNLRALGANRALILVDKRRWVATTGFGGVNINNIPQMLIDQVEVVTGGASAQWGSDAISGVINFRTDRSLEGGRAEMRYGATGHGDARDMFGSAAYGFSFADDRGHVSIGVEYNENRGILYQADRDWGRQSWGIVGNPEDTGPDDGIPARIITDNVLLGFGTPGGYLPLALGNHPAVAQIMFGPGGEILPYDIGEYPIPSAFAALPMQAGGSGGSLGLTSPILAPFQREAGMALFDYELGENLHFFFDLSWGRTETDIQVVQPWNFIGAGPDVILADNPYIPEPLQQTMAANDIAELVMARTNEDHGFLHNNSDSETTQLAMGLQGQWGEWLWDAYWTHGESDFNVIVRNNVITQNRLLAVDAIRDPVSGEIVCRANANGANGAPGCAPLNLFGSGSPSQAALDYIHADTVVPIANQQDVVAASMSGEPFELPAGPVSIAFGLEYRKERSSTRFDELAEAGAYFINNGTDVAGSYSVSEAFVEAGVPLFESSGGTSLDLTGAVRYAHYSSSGGTVPWYIGGVLATDRGIKLRGTVSHDIRAPNVSELFTVRTLSFGTVINPETGESGLTKLFFGGNPDLTEETADTQTIGIVWQPDFLASLELSIDWYRTEVSDAVGIYAPQTIVDNCFEFDIGCENVVIVDGSIDSVDGTLDNLSSFVVEGVDFAAEWYASEVAGGELELRGLGTYYIENSTADVDTTYDDAGVVGPDSYAGSSTPRWRLNLTADWTRGPFGFLAQLLFIDGGKYLNDQGPEDINDNSVDSQTLINLVARYEIELEGERNVEFYLGVDNAFDSDPPVAPLDFVSNYVTNPWLYSQVGRNYFAGARFNF